MPKIIWVESREALKWIYHAKACRGDLFYLYYMKECLEVDDVNQWLQGLAEPYRVITLPDWVGIIEAMDYEGMEQRPTVPDWAYTMVKTGELPEWYIHPHELKPPYEEIIKNGVK